MAQAQQEIRQATEIDTTRADQHPLPWPSADSLPAALQTGHALIDAEHVQLLTSISAVRRICVDMQNLPSCIACSEGQRVRCDQGLVGVLGDLLAFILDHFETEENIMRQTLLTQVDRAVCEAHMEDHAAISGKIQEIVAGLDPLFTVSRIRELDDLLERWISNHIQLHDLFLTRWVEDQRLADDNPATGLAGEA